MAVRRVIVALAIGGCISAAAVGASDAVATSKQLPSGQQTHPRVTPPVGGRHSRFELSFTLARAPGRAGYVETDYRPFVSPPPRARASCSPNQPALVVSGTQGSVSRIALHPPAGGWCKGEYEVTVFLQQSPTCGPPVESASGKSASDIYCPESPAAAESVFPVQDENTGEARFTVR